MGMCCQPDTDSIKTLATKSPWFLNDVRWLRHNRLEIARERGLLWLLYNFPSSVQLTIWWCPRAPWRSCQQRGTSPTAIKQQLVELTEKSTRLNNSLKLLKSEIDTKNKEIGRKKKVIRTINRRLKGSLTLTVVFAVTFLNINIKKSPHQLPMPMRKFLFSKTDPVLSKVIFRVSMINSKIFAIKSALWNLLCNRLSA